VNFNWQVIVSIQVIISPQWANTLQRQSKGSGDSGTGMEGCTAGVAKDTLRRIVRREWAECAAIASRSRENFLTKRHELLTPDSPGWRVSAGNAPGRFSSRRSN